MNTADDLVQLYRLSEIVSFAEYLPLDLIAQRNAEPVYPVTIGELLVTFALDIVLVYEWESESCENAAEPLESILNQLDTGVDRPEVWKDLFKANAALIARLKHTPTT